MANPYSSLIDLLIPKEIKYIEIRIRNTAIEINNITSETKFFDTFEKYARKFILEDVQKEDNRKIFIFRNGDKEKIVLCERS